MKGYPNEAVQRAWARLVRAQQKALASIEETLRKAKLPPLAWYDTLLELERAGGSLRPFELEREMLLAQYNLSRLIDRLEKAGYVERRACADDRRGHIIAITRAGKAIRRRTWSVYGPAIQAAVGDRLSPKQIDTLNALLGALGGRRPVRPSRAPLGPDSAGCANPRTFDFHLACEPGSSSAFTLTGMGFPKTARQS